MCHTVYMYVVLNVSHFIFHIPCCAIQFLQSMLWNPFSAIHNFHSMVHNLCSTIHFQLAIFYVLRLENKLRFMFRILRYMMRFLLQSLFSSLGFPVRHSVYHLLKLSVPFSTLQVTFFKLWRCIYSMYILIPFV